MYFYRKRRITGWGMERSTIHPDNATIKFKYTDLVQLTDDDLTLSLNELTHKYLPETPTFKTRRNKEILNAQLIEATSK